MIYSIDNSQKFYSDLGVICGHIHDSMCTCFEFDREKREVLIDADNDYYNTKCQMRFCNVKMFLSTNFDVWSICADMINAIGPIDVAKTIKSLNNLTAIEQAGGLQATDVDSLLGVQILFRTGNEVYILFENMRIEFGSKKII